MAGYNTEWSEETYRLDEVGHKCSLPQVIQVTEGIYKPNEVDSFSAGDIFKIDQCVQLQKVVAQVVKTPVKPVDHDSGYDRLKTVKPIHIPLNYKGKLQVITEIKKYISVRELATDLPPYAQFLQALTVSVEDGKSLNIAAGTKVELDRVRLGPDRLIMRTIDSGRRQIEVLLSKRCQFRSIQDETHYTLTEMIERYQLPQTIQFLDSRVEQSDIQDPLEELGQTVTVPVIALRINKIISQTVLIGHYSEPDTHKRTIVVVPLDSPEVGEIPVKLYEGVEDYPDVGQLLLEKLGTALTKGPYNCCKVTRVSEDILDAVNKTSKDTEDVAPPPVPRRLERRKSEEPPMIAPRDRRVEGNAPPVPPRPRTVGETDHLYLKGQYDKGSPLQPKPKPKPRPKPKERGDYVGFSLKQEHKSKSAQEEEEENDDYEIPEDPPPVVRGHTLPTGTAPLSPTAGTSQSVAALALADISFDTSKEYEECKALGPAPPPPIASTSSASSSAGLPQRSPKSTKSGTFPFTIGKQDKSKKKGTAQTPKIGVSSAANFPKDSGGTTKEKNIEYDTDGHHYDKIDESRLDNIIPILTKPIAHVSPQAKSSGGAQTKPHQTKLSSEKEFYQLNIEELQERLIKNGLDKFAKFCFDGRLNGKFFADMKEEGFQSLELSPSDEWKLRKLIQGQHTNTRL